MVNIESKNILHLLSLNFFLSVSGYAFTNVAKMSVLVVDEQMVPIPGAKALIEFPMFSSGEGLTDSMGLFVHTGRYQRRGIAYGSKEGYYDGRADEQRFDCNALGMGTPWNPVKTIRLKKKINPHSMAFGWVPNFPVLDSPCAFDFVAGDWLPPYGSGTKTDVVFNCIASVGGNGANFQLHSNVKIEFSDSKGGLIRYKAGDLYSSPFAESELKSPVEAPVDGYLNRYTWEFGAGDYTNAEGCAERGFYGNLDPSRTGENFMFRIRSETNAAGEVVSARYGKFEGVFIDWAPGGLWRFCGHYYVNKTDTRNLEHLMILDFKKNEFIRPWPGPNEAYEPDEGRRWKVEEFRSVRDKGQRGKE